MFFQFVMTNVLHTVPLIPFGSVYFVFVHGPAGLTELSQKLSLAFILIFGLLNQRFSAEYFYAIKGYSTTFCDDQNNVMQKKNDEKFSYCSIILNL